MSISAKPKKRGRPATGRDPMIGLRASPKLRRQIEAWAKRQDDKPSLSEAMRRLIEAGLRDNDADGARSMIERALKAK
jgi:hypothetical protein